MTLFIVGAGGFGRETYDAVLAARDVGRAPVSPASAAPGGASGNGSAGNGSLGNGRELTEPVMFCDHARAGREDPRPADRPPGRGGRRLRGGDLRPGRAGPAVGRARGPRADPPYDRAPPRR